MADPNILVDENVPYAADAFGTIGHVRLKHGRQITSADLADVDVLVVRSITHVTRDLLAGTRVRFVGTATSGIDHVEVADVHALGIAFYGALGCNANAVAEYMTAAWLEVAGRVGCELRGRRVGIVGVGHVGSLVAAKAQALGMIPVLNDPPKARVAGSVRYEPLDTLHACDIITCHTPLTRTGPDPTLGLIGDSFLSAVRPGTWLCNAGRGGVVDETALHRALDGGRVGACVLDVWNREPAVDPSLVSRVDLASPHIAGYSLEGKLNGTAMVYEAVCRFLGIAPCWTLEAAAPPTTVPAVHLDATGQSEREIVARAVHAVYPVGEDDARFRSAMASAPDADSRGAAFDALRKSYPVRREFRHTRVTLTGAPPRVVDTLRLLGFQVTAEPGA